MLKSIAIVVLLIMAGQPGRAAESLIYDIRAGGFRFGELGIDREAGEASYSVTVTAGAQGLFGLLTRARYSGRSEGTMEGQRLVPELFTASSRRIFKSREAEVRFSNGAPDKVVMRPARDRTFMSDPTRVTEPVIDPLTYLGQVTGRQAPECPPRQALYDGRRQTAIGFGPAETGAEGFTCRGSYEIISGPSHSLQPKARRFGLVLDYAPLGQSGYRLKRVLFISGDNRVQLDLLAPPVK